MQKNGFVFHSILLKVWRRPTKPSAVESDDTNTHQQTNDFDCFIVDASEQDILQAPSLSSAMLLPMLGISTDNVLPAAGRRSIAAPVLLSSCASRVNQAI